MAPKTLLLSLAAALSATLAITPSLQAQAPAKGVQADRDQADPNRSHGYPNFDIRLQEDGSPIPSVLDSLTKHPKSPEHEAALARLRSTIPFADVDTDALFATPRFVRSWAHFLTDKNDALTPVEVVRAFVADYQPLFEIDPAEITLAAATRNYVTDHNGVRHLTLQQRVNGIDLFFAILTANVMPDGRLINVASTMLPRPAGGEFVVPDYKLTDLEAIRAAAAIVGVSVTEDPTPAQDPRGASHKRRWNNSVDFRADQAIISERVYFPMSRDDIRAAWLVVIPTRGVGHTYEMVIDAADGAVLHRANQLCFDTTQPITFRAFRDFNPTPGPGLTTNSGFRYPFASRALFTINPAQVSPFSPNGWINDGNMETVGNNVDAHSDLDANNAADLPRPNGGPSRTFDFVMDYALSPAAWLKASIVQGFYFTNVYHDRLYALGFNEVAGNFQTNNFGLGGLGNDPVQLDVQDSSDLNNANFGTPSDGSSGRCQMFIFTSATPNRDCNLDTDVLFHELTHGTSNRLTGGPANSNALNANQSGGMGEGWSDFVALCLRSVSGQNPDGFYAAGSYSTNNYYRGIRRYPYTTSMSSTTNALTWDAYGTSGTTSLGVARSTQVHNTGEIWCTTLWECRAGLHKRYGFAANQLILQLVIDGMKLQPANPSFSQARDAILAADLVNNGGVNHFILWTGFAKRGLGSGFVTGSSSSTSVAQSFTTPPFAETADAGDLPASATVINGAGPVTGISGGLSANDVDMYRINVCNFSTFSASTVGQPAPFNTQLFLFNSAGQGIVFNDDASLSDTQSAISQFVTSNGDYFLAVSGADRDPANALGEIWLDLPMATQHVPDGPGALGGPVTSWTGAGVGGQYVITLTGACAVSTFDAPVPALPLTAFGAPTPNVITYPAAPNIVFRINPIVATLPASSGISITLDCSPIGLGTLILVDNGTGGDSAAADGVFTAQATVATLLPGNYAIPYTVTDGQSRAFNDTMLLTVIDLDSACCLSNGGCIVLPTLGCNAAGGVTRGVGIPCEIQPCYLAHAEIEPNNSAATATDADGHYTLPPANLFHFGFTGDISASTDADYIRMGSMQVGDLITFSESGTAGQGGTNADTLNRLYRENSGSPLQITSDDDDGPGLDSLIYRFSVTTSDTWYARPYRANSSNTGTYRAGLFLENISTAPATGGTFTAETEPNNTASAAASNDASTAWRRVQYMAATTGSVASGNSDFVKYTLASGDVITIVVTASAALDARVTLRDPSGTTIASEDGTSSGPGGNSPLYGYNIATAGVYTIEVAAASGSGAYSAVLYRSTNTPPALPCPADYNKNGTATIDDLFIYINMWLAGCTGQAALPCGGVTTDINGGGSTIDDLFIFINLWLAGC